MLEVPESILRFSLKSRRHNFCGFNGAQRRFRFQVNHIFLGLLMYKFHNKHVTNYSRRDANIAVQVPMLDTDGRRLLLKRAIELFCADFLTWKQTAVRFGDYFIINQNGESLIIDTAIDPRLLNDTVTEVDDNVQDLILQYRETVRNADSLIFFWPIHYSITSKSINFL